MTTEFSIPEINSDKIWSDVERSWPETVVVNKKEILPGSVVEACMVLCPLYSQGSLKESKLIMPPLQIVDSRVAGKIKAYLETTSVLNKTVQGESSHLKLNVVFSNMGVILGSDPSQADIDLLSYHENLYKELFNKFSSKTGIPTILTNYDDWGVVFPRFVNLKSKVPDVGEVPEDLKKEESKMIWQLNSYINPAVPIEDTKKNRHVIERVLGTQGMDYDAVFWLIAGYLAFDPNISRITKENGIYLVSERLEPLFGIARLTKALKDLTRIQIKA